MKRLFVAGLCFALLLPPALGAPSNAEAAGPPPVPDRYYSELEVNPSNLEMNPVNIEMTALAAAPAPDLTVSVTPGQLAGRKNEWFRFSITIKNQGNASAAYGVGMDTDFSVTLRVPASFSRVRANPQQTAISCSPPTQESGSWEQPMQTVYCEFQAPLYAGSSVTLPVEMKAPAEAGAYRIEVSAETGGGNDSNSANDDLTKTITIR